MSTPLAQVFDQIRHFSRTESGFPQGMAAIFPADENESAPIRKSCRNMPNRVSGHPYGKNHVIFNARRRHFLLKTSPKMHRKKSASFLPRRISWMRCPFQSERSAENLSHSYRDRFSVGFNSEAMCQRRLAEEGAPPARLAPRTPLYRRRVAAGRPCRHAADIRSRRCRWCGGRAARRGCWRCR